jgi:hypothetical protein
MSKSRRFCPLPPGIIHPAYVNRMMSLLFLGADITEEYS